MQRRLAAFLFVSCAAAPGGAAQSLSQFERPKSPALAPTLACRDLRGLPGFEFSIDSATLAGESCLVQGLVQPEIRFEIGLPASWNGRLYMFGNGGYAGESLQAPPRAARRDAALAKGFV